MKDEDRKSLVTAKALLENPSFIAKISNYLGSPIEAALGALPEKAQALVAEASKAALTKALEAALLTMDKNVKGEESSNILHKLMAIATGAGSGFFGLQALLIELPISTTIMFRSIADIARSENHDVSGLGVRMRCLEVFALGGPSSKDDATETGYFAVRAAMAKAVSEAMEHVASKSITVEGSPALVKLIAQLAQRYGIVVTEKAAAQAIPLIGALGGGIINGLFIDHYQSMARGHFTVLRLESVYGQDKVKQIYKQL